MWENHSLWPGNTHYGQNLSLSVNIKMMLFFFITTHAYKRFENLRGSISNLDNIYKELINGDLEFN